MSYVVGQRIKAIRISKGMTLEEFGELFNCSKGVVCNWEKGRNKPNKNNIKKISKIGGISIKKLLESDYRLCKKCEYDKIEDDFNYCPNCGENI